MQETSTTHVRLVSKQGINLKKEFSKRDFYRHHKDKERSLEELIDIGHAIIDLIIERQLTGKKSRNGYTYINHDEFRKIKDYPSDIKEFLIACDIIKCNNSYKVNERAMGYKISNTYAFHPTVIHNCTDPKLCKYYRKYYMHDHFLNRFYNNKLSININEYEIRSIVNKSTHIWIIKNRNIRKEQGKKAYIEYIKNYKSNLRTILQITIEKITLCKYTYKITPSGRHFNSLTNCKSELRKYLRYDGNKLFEVDIKNAAPYLSIALIEAIPRMIDYILGSDPQLKRSELKTAINAIPEREKNEYRRLVLRGELYEHLKSRIDKRYSRDFIKEHFYYFLYNKNTSTSEIKSLFKEIFPNIYNLFHYVKINFKKTRSEGRKNYETGNALCLAIYKLESYLVIDTVAKLFNDKNSEVPVYTIHDSLMSTKDGINKLFEIIKTESQKLIGYEAPVSTDL